jgi:hypothetical protein
MQSDVVFYWSVEMLSHSGIVLLECGTVFTVCYCFYWGVELFLVWYCFIGVWNCFLSLVLFFNGVWNCSHSLVLFLLGCGTVLTVWYCFYWGVELFSQTGIVVLECGTVLTVWFWVFWSVELFLQSGSGFF